VGAVVLSGVGTLTVIGHVEYYGAASLNGVGTMIVVSLIIVAETGLESAGGGRGLTSNGARGLTSTGNRSGL